MTAPSECHTFRYYLPVLSLAEAKEIGETRKASVRSFLIFTPDTQIRKAEWASSHERWFLFLAPAAVYIYRRGKERRALSQDRSCRTSCDFYFFIFIFIPFFSSPQKELYELPGVAPSRFPPESLAPATLVPVIIRKTYPRSLVLVQGKSDRNGSQAVLSPLTCHSSLSISRIYIYIILGKR